MATQLYSVPNVWTLVADGTPGNVGFQLRSGQAVEVLAGGASVPGVGAVGYIYTTQMRGELMGALSRFGPGTPSALYMRAAMGSQSVVVMVMDDA